MRRRMPWVLTLPLSLGGSWLAHAVGRAMTTDAARGAQVREHLERAAREQAGTGTPSIAFVTLLAPFAAIALAVLVARMWSMVAKRPWRGAQPAWFLALPAVAYLAAEVLERLSSGGTESFGVHSLREPGLLLALALQLPFGAMAYVIARLLLAAGRAIVSRARGVSSVSQHRPRIALMCDIRTAPLRWSCLVGAHGLRGPPVYLLL